MSYVIVIRRADGKDLAQAEVEDALAADGAFRRTAAALWTWQGLGVGYANGELHTDGSRGWGSDQALAQLRAVAARLDASVIGEEGEDLTAAAGAPPGTRAALAGGAIAILMLPFVLLLGLLRLPWLFWKMVRSARRPR